MNIKKFISAGVALIATVTIALGAPGGSGGYTGAPTPTAITVNLLPYTPFSVSSNNITIQSVSVLTPLGSGSVSFYDVGTTNPPFYGTNVMYYTNASYVSYANGPTNLVTSFVGYNGYTNYYTNVGTFTYFTTNAAATNALPYQGIFALMSGVVGTYNNPMSFQQGAVAIATTNATLIIYYTPNR